MSIDCEACGDTGIKGAAIYGGHRNGIDYVPESCPVCALTVRIVLPERSEIRTLAHLGPYVDLLDLADWFERNADYIKQVREYNATII